MTRNKMWFVALAVSALATTSAYAAGEKMGGESSTGSTTSQVGTQGSASFSQLDKDSNGAIDSNEAAAVTGLDFANADADGDGKLSRSEFEAAAGKGKSGSPAPDRQPDGGPGK